MGNINNFQADRKQDSESRNRSRGKTNSTINYGEIFKKYLTSNINSINNIGSAYVSFTNQYFPNEIITMLSAAASEKMTLSQADLKEHSFCISKAPISYWVCTLALSVNNARNWFMAAYGGYSKLLEKAWNSAHYRGPGCEVLVHIVYGRESLEDWVKMTIFPVDSQGFVARFGIKPILPSELLTKAEK